LNTKMASFGALHLVLVAVAVTLVAAAPAVDDVTLVHDDVRVGGVSRERRTDDNALAVTVERLAQQLATLDAKVTNDVGQLNARLQTALDFANEPVVAFTARIKGDDQTGYGFKQVVHFDDVIYNAGGGYNLLDGVFTAPRNGTYVFFLQMMAHKSDRRVYLDLVKNDAFLSRAHAGYSNYESGSTLAVARLVRGDRVKVEITAGSSFTGGYYTTFAGFRVSPY